jgi:Zn-dependent alcohol dehydrogenase
MAFSLLRRSVTRRIPALTAARVVLPSSRLTVSWRAMSSSAGPMKVQAAVARAPGMMLDPSAAFTLHVLTSCWTAGQPFTFDELTLRAPRDNEILVKVTATGPPPHFLFSQVSGNPGLTLLACFFAGVCHTDIAVKDRNLCAFPMVLGHEGVGIVERIGSRVTSVKVGDHVMMRYVCTNSTLCFVW